jgi:hypothetical protein
MGFGLNHGRSHVISMESDRSIQKVRFWPSFCDGCRHSLLRAASQQESHHLPPMWITCVSHSKKEVRVMRLSRSQNAILCLGQKSAREANPRHRSYGSLKASDPQTPGDLSSEGLNARSDVSDLIFFLLSISTDHFLRSHFPLVILIQKVLNSHRARLLRPWPADLPPKKLILQRRGGGRLFLGIVTIIIPVRALRH